MFVQELATTKPEVRLIKPEPNRDAPLGVAWLAGKEGRQTLALMGVRDDQNQASTLQKERARIQNFLDTAHQYVWMIELDKKVVGAIWLDLEPTPQVPAPAIHLMIGDPLARGRGAGSAAFGAVVEWLRANEPREPLVHTRYLVSNKPAAILPQKFGFTLLGEPYQDADGLKWQNACLER